MHGLWYCVLPHLLVHCDGHSGHFAPQKYEAASLALGFFDPKFKKKKNSKMKEKGKTVSVFSPFCFFGVSRRVES